MTRTESTKSQVTPNVDLPVDKFSDWPGYSYVHYIVFFYNHELSVPYNRVRISLSSPAKFPGRCHPTAQTPFTAPRGLEVPDLYPISVCDGMF